MEFDEAKLRGIDVVELQDESFTSYGHRQMMARHEARTKLFHEYAKMHPSSTPTDTPKVTPIDKPAKVRKNKKQPQFTEAQIRIAQAVLEKEMKKK
jgi:hypothetical protein